MLTDQYEPIYVQTQLKVLHAHACAALPSLPELIADNEMINTVCYNTCNNHIVWTLQ